MTLAELESTPGETLRPKDVANFLGLDYQMMIYVAKDDPDRFRAVYGFPCIVSGNRTKIPKRIFCRWLRGDAS